jgi:F0F1-type ATP synthase membrane subunit c/vacuolar-type H+-ATPase subunit K
MGAAYGTARSGAAVAAVGAERPDLVMTVRSRPTSYGISGSGTWTVADGVAVAPPNSDGGDYLSVCARSVSAYCLGYESASEAKLLFIQVRKLQMAAAAAPKMGKGNILKTGSGNMHLAAGLSVGLTGLAAGYGIGVIGEHGVRGYLKQSRLFMPLVLLLIFAEVLGLYG